MAQNPQKRFPVVKRLGRIYTPFRILIRALLFFITIPNDRLSSLHALSHPDNRSDIGGKVEVNPRSKPNHTKTFAPFPEAGARLMWTLKGDMKMDTFRAFCFKNRSSSHSPIWMIFPSAGERMMFRRDGIFLFGFLKKKAMNRVRRIPKSVKIFHPINTKKRVRRALGIRKRNPSLAIGH